MIHSVLIDAAAQRPDDKFVTFLDDREYTASELHSRARRAASALTEYGAGPGERVVFLLGNRVEFLDLLFGASLAGAISVPLNTEWRGELLRNVMASIDPAVVVAEAGLVETVDLALNRDRSTTRVVIGRTEDPNWIPYDAWVTAKSHETPEARPTDAVMIMYTSGTTGPSKGVVSTHGTFAGKVAAVRHILGYEAGDVAFTPLPLFHGNALVVSLLGCLGAGGSVVIAPRFSASAFWRDVCNVGATHTSFVGVMLGALLSRQPSIEERMHRLRRAVVVPTPSDVEGVRERFGFDVVALYGLTDMNIVIGSPGGEHRDASCGRALPWWELSLVDASDLPVPDGDVGELVIRPRLPNWTTLGYWRLPEATIESRRNLWFHTGDLFRRDADGWYYFVDRAKDAIRRSGENISSFEVERALLSHPEIREAAVFAVPSALAEDEVMAAIVVADPSGSTDLPAIVAHCERELPYYAVPRYIDVVPGLPRTETQKIRKDELQRAGVTATTFDRGPSSRARRVPS